MASKIIERMSHELFERRAKEGMTDAIDEGLAAGEDENTLARRILKKLYDENGPLVRAASAIPGFSYAPHMLTIGLVEGFEKFGLLDKIIPDSNRREVMAAKQVVKLALPGLIMGAGEGLSEAIDRRVDEIRSGSSVHPEDRKAQADMLVLWPDVFGFSRYFLPRRDNGDIVIDSTGFPVCVDPDYIEARRRHLMTNPAKKVTKGTGRNRTTEEINPTVPTMVVTFAEYIYILMKDGKKMSETDIDGLRELLSAKRQTPIGNLSDKTWAVFRAFVRSMTTQDVIGREEAEDLIKRMRACLRNETTLPGEVNEMVGEAFFDGIGADGTFPSDVVELVKITMDQFLGGDQSAKVQGIKLFRWAWGAIETIGVDARYWQGLGILSLVPFAAVLTWVVLAFVAARWLWLGFSTAIHVFDATGSEVLITCLGSEMVGGAAALYWGFAGATLGWAITWPFPWLAKFAKMVSFLFPGESDPRLVSLGRKITSFSLVSAWGLNSLLITLSLAPMFREIIFGAVSFLSLAYALILAENGSYTKLRRAVDSGADGLLRFILLPTVGLNLLSGLYHQHTGRLLTVQSFLGWLSGTITSAHIEMMGIAQQNAYNRTMVWAGYATVVAILGWIVLGRLEVVKRKFNGRDVVQVRKMSGPKNLLLAAVIASVAVSCMQGVTDTVSDGLESFGLWDSKVSVVDMTVIDGENKTRTKETEYESGLTKKKVQGTVHTGSSSTGTSQSSNAPNFSRVDPCAGNPSYEQKKRLGCR